MPGNHYQVSPRSFPEKLEEPEYLEGDEVRKVKSKGEITFRNQFYYVGSSFCGKLVAMRKACMEGIYEVFYGPFKIGRIDETKGDSPKSKYISIKDQNTPFCSTENELMCKPCLRTPVKDVSGLYSPWRSVKYIAVNR